ncbi:hypothetical protein [Microcoleus sp. FACHB-1515]|nr:hypothetical protein [Microcoleus sp. FACHB-1515]
MPAIELVSLRPLPPLLPLANLPQLKIHAGYALRLGVMQDELKEII